MELTSTLVWETISEREEGRINDDHGGGEGAVGDVEVNQGVCPSPRVVMIANDDEDDDDDE